jgi:hypothetical protein
MQQPHFDDLPREKIEISQSAVRSVSGGTVTVTQSAVQHLLAAEADIRQSSVGTVKGEKVSLRQAATVSWRDVSVDGRSRSCCWLRRRSAARCVRLRCRAPSPWEPVSSSGDG